jgi:PAS domain S-box-containing protein
VSRLLRVLLVEDSVDDAILVIRQLQKDGYEPIYERVEDAQSMTEALEHQPWDIIITDYVLPQFSGLEALEIIQQRQPDIPCIVLSGKITDETAVAAMRAGARDYIMKDNLKRLGSVIARELDEFAIRREVATAQRKLQATQTSFRNVILSNIDPVLIIDSQEKVLFLNPAAEDFLGQTGDSLLGGRAGFPVKQARSIEKEFVRADGSVVIADIRVSDIEWEGEKAYLATLRDITERKKTERALQESNEFNSTLLRYAPNPIIVLNPDRSIRHLNPAFEELTGFSRKELIGRQPPFPWWLKDDQQQNERILNKKSGQLVQHEIRRFINSKGEEFWVESTTIPVKDVEDKIMYTLYSWIDITEQKRLNEEMEYYVRKVTEAQEEERRRIARELHDDTAQSLSMLILEIDFLLHRRKDLSPETVADLMRIKEGAGRSLEEVRRFSHELRPGLLDNLGLQAAIEQMINENNHDDRCQIQFMVNGEDKRLPSDVELTLFRIAQESLNNVRKHSGASHVEVCLDFTDSLVRLDVSDNGKGFDKQVERQAIAGGHMGLIGMRERARLIGADFCLDSRPGKGTRVSIAVASRRADTEKYEDS